MIISVILAAGMGTRMKSLKKNKTCLSLIDGYNYPMILEIIKNLPLGTKIVVVNYRKEDVIKATKDVKNIIYCEQPELNGTGGAIISCYDTIRDLSSEYVIITMGDVPLVKRNTYFKLIQGLEENHMMVLGFKVSQKKQYGLLDIDGDQVKRIVEWSIWKDLSDKEQSRLNICNSGIYAIRKEILLDYIPVLKDKPHIVIKEREGVLKEVKEFFLTDLVEYMHNDGLKIGYQIASLLEVMGVDDPDALSFARQVFISKRI